MTDIISETITETLKWMNGIGDIFAEKKETVINYSRDGKQMQSYGIQFNSEPQVSRLRPVYEQIANPIIQGIKFNSD